MKAAVAKVVQEMQIRGKGEMALALSMVCSARNLIPNATGFSPAQWVTGRQPRVPGTLLDRPGDLPAIHASAEQPSMMRRLAIQSAAKAAMIAMDSSVRLRRALLRRSRPERIELKPGGSVYFWRQRRSGKKTKALWQSGWRGPGIVVASQGRSAVFVSYRGAIVKTSPELIRRATPSESLTFQQIMTELSTAQALLDGPGFAIDEEPLGVPPPFDDEDFIEQEPEVEGVEEDVIEPTEVADDASLPDVDPGDRHSEFDEFADVVWDTGPRNPSHPVPPAETSSEPGGRPERAAPSTPAPPPQPEDVPLPEDDEWELAPDDDMPDGLAGASRDEVADHLHPRKRQRTAHYTLFLAQRAVEVRLKSLSPELLEEFRKADLAEWQSWLDHEAVDVLTDAEASKLLPTLPKDLVLGSRMVRVDKNKDKRDASGVPLPPRPKSRIVMRGFEDPDFSSRTDAPTLSVTASHLIFTIAATQKLDLLSCDVSSAFLNGRAMTRELYARVPHDLLVPEMRGKLLRLKKGVYGLRQAPRLWWERLREEMLRLGFTASRLEPTLFCLDKVVSGKRSILALVGTHVDDLVCACSPEGFKTLVKLADVFQIKEWTRKEFLYCGRKVRQLPDYSIEVSMKDYCRKLTLLQIPKHRRANPDDPCSVDEVRQFRGVMGQLSRLANQGRPDLSFAVSKLQGYNADPTIQHLVDANAVVRVAQQFEDTVLRFPAMSLEGMCFLSVTDASFATMRDGKSQSGVMTLIGDSNINHGGSGQFILIFWKSCRQKRACRSTFGSELLACSEGVDSCDYLRGLWSEVVLGNRDPRDALEQPPPAHWSTDSKDLYDSLVRDSTGGQCTEKRLALELIILKSMLERPFDSVHWVQTRQMLADVLTKGMEGTYMRARLADNLWSYTNDEALGKKPKVPKKKSLEQLEKSVKLSDARTKAHFSRFKTTHRSRTTPPLYRTYQ